MEIKFYCSNCSRFTDSNCLRCNLFYRNVLGRLDAFAELLSDLKDVYDMCSDSSDLRKSVRLEKSAAFDSAVDLFDDCFSLDLYTLYEQYDNLPEQFPLVYFDPVDLPF